MKIYTRTGDTGATGLFGGARVEKDDPRVEAYGTVDETNAALGMARATGLPAPLGSLLERIQSDLFQLGAELACVPGKEAHLGTPLVTAESVRWLEAAIDEHELALAPLKTFVLPAGTPGAAALHLARTICRRAERRVVGLRHQTPLRNEIVEYLNRLSDLLFVLARRANAIANVPDAPWAPRAGS